MSRTLTPAPTDRSMWRRRLRVVHPDGGGDEDMFVWVRNLQEYVTGDAIEEDPRHLRGEPPRHPRSFTAERIDYTQAFEKGRDFDDLTRRAVALADEVDSWVYARLLRMLDDCRAVDEMGPPLHRMQREGATYKSRAAIAHRVGMTKEKRVGWYRVAESVPLSQRHAGHIFKRLQEDAA